MGRNLEKLIRERDEINRLYDSPSNKWLKYTAFIIIATVIALLASMIIWIDDISRRSMLFMQGCAGTGAAIFVALIGILSYRVNCRHIRNRNHQRDY